MKEQGPVPTLLCDPQQLTSPLWACFINEDGIVIVPKAGLGQVDASAGSCSHSWQPLNSGVFQNQQERARGPGCWCRREGAGHRAPPLRSLPSSRAPAPDFMSAQQDKNLCSQRDPLSRPGTPRLPSEPCAVDVPHPGLPVDVFPPARLPVSPMRPERPRRQMPGQPPRPAAPRHPHQDERACMHRAWDMQGRRRARHICGFTCSWSCLPGPFNVSTRAAPAIRTSPGSSRQLEEAGCQLPYSLWDLLPRYP